MAFAVPIFSEGFDIDYVICETAQCVVVVLCCLVYKRQYTNYLEQLYPQLNQKFYHIRIF